MDIPFLRRPVDAQLDALTAELQAQWLAFNRELKQGKLTHLDYDKDTQKLIWRKPKAENQRAHEQALYEQLPYCDVADVFRFVNGQCQFLSALTPLQPRYAKKMADADSLMAVIIAQAMNHGNQVMARTSDIPYHVLESTYQQYLRQSTLHAASDCISNAIAALPIFPHYSFDLDALYGAVDGQKFGVERPTVKARYSRKYFGRGKGVVAYTLLCNHVPLNGYLIGAHEYEAHHVLDIWYRNTSDIVPMAITGDMHSINKANFAILYWFGLRFEPRFTNLDDQLQELYCADDLGLYEKCLIRPVGVIDRHLIVSEKANVDRIVATLGFKEMTQGTLIRKLCTYTAPNPTRRAIFEFDKLIRSIYTLRYLRDPPLERHVHRSQNRIEHARSVSAQRKAALSKKACARVLIRQDSQRCRYHRCARCSWRAIARTRLPSQHQCAHATGRVLLASARRSAPLDLRHGARSTPPSARRNPTASVPRQPPIAVVPNPSTNAVPKTRATSVARAAFISWGSNVESPLTALPLSRARRAAAMSAPSASP